MTVASTAIFALPRSMRLELPDSLYALTEGNPFLSKRSSRADLCPADAAQEAGLYFCKKGLTFLFERHIGSLRDTAKCQTQK